MPNYSSEMTRAAHVVLYSTDAEADRAFFRDVLDYPFVDAGHGWLIFALPPAELAIHPANANDTQELFLMCDGIEAFIAQMSLSGVACSDLQTERWGGDHAHHPSRWRSIGSL
jgi:catechol 2,3-dioxygenase-like lactoylglutathione lyase family enzyme